VENFRFVKMVVPAIPSSAATASIAALKFVAISLSNAIKSPVGYARGERSLRAPVPMVTPVTSKSFCQVVSPVSASSLTRVATQLGTNSLRTLKTSDHHHPRFSTLLAI